MRYLILLSMLVLSACAIVPAPNITEKPPAPPIIKNLYIVPSQPTVALSDIYTIDDIQKKQFLSLYNSSSYLNLLPNKRISRYLQENLGEFSFFADTLTANESLTRKQGNCLSMAIVTKALAELVNVEAQFELVATPPLYQKAGDVILISQHVRTLLFDPKPGELPGYDPLWRSFIRFDYFSAGQSYRLRKVDELEFHTMYYTNKAAEALGRNEDALAFWYARQSLLISQSEPQTINILAMIHNRAGQEDYAEKLYQYGLKYSGENFELLHNYHQLLTDSNRLDEANVIEKRLRKYEDPNPYKWIDMGDKEYLAKNFSSAIYYYKKANKMANYLHEGYAGIAKAHYSLGNLRSAKRAIKKAIKNTHNQDLAEVYRSQYESFQKHSNDG